jgi:hypothetical protein
MNDTRTMIPTTTHRCPKRQLVAAGRATVMDPAGPVDLPAPTAVRGVIDRQQQVRRRVHQMGQDQVQDGHADLVDRPAGRGEEPVRPVMRPGLGQPGPGEHATDRAPPGLGDHPDRQGAEDLECRRGETPREGVQQPAQRDR